MCYGTVTALIFAPILLQFSLTLILGRERQEYMKCLTGENCQKKRRAQAPFFSGLARDQTVKETDRKATLPIQGSAIQKMVLK